MNISVSRKKNTIIIRLVMLVGFFMIFIILKNNYTLTKVKSEKTPKQRKVNNNSINHETATEGKRLLHTASQTYGNDIKTHPGGIIECNDDVKTHPGGIKKYNDDVTKVVIYSKMRTGSSFTGDLLGASKKVFYTFEPLWVFTSDASPAFQHTSKIRLLNESVSCNFSEVSSLTTNGWTYHSLCHNMFREKKEICSSLPLSTLERICQGYSYVVAKVIRLEKLSMLQDLMAEGVKVIQLVRDPRGVFNSRLHLGGQSDVRKFNRTLNSEDYDKFRHHKQLLGDSYVSIVNETINYCRTIEEDAQVKKHILKNQTLKGNYLLVRYEDLSISPITISKKIYSFLGISFDEEVYSWVNKSTTNRAGNKEFMGTSKNSTEVVTSWRHQLLLSPFIELIQEVCQGAMQELEYYKVNSTTLLDEAFKVFSTGDNLI